MSNFVINKAETYTLSCSMSSVNPILLQRFPHRHNILYRDAVLDYMDGREDIAPT